MASRSKIRNKYVNMSQIRAECYCSTKVSAMTCNFFRLFHGMMSIEDFLKFSRNSTSQFSQNTFLTCAMLIFPLTVMLNVTNNFLFGS